MAATLNLTEPCSTGIGGDAFALYYNAKTKQVTCMQGNGASGAQFSLDLLNSRGIGDPAEGLKPLDPRSGLSITVPGAAALWEDLVVQHGQLKLSEVLGPAICLAEEGFPIHPVTAEQWTNAFLQGDEALRPNNDPIQSGQVFRNPDLAQTFRLLGEYGAAKGFSSGRIAEAIIQATQDNGGVLTLEDLADHRTAHADPISTVYRGVRVYQTPPSSHGLAVLLALNFLQQLTQREPIDLNSFALGSTSFPPEWASKFDADEIHRSLECMRRAYCDGLQFIGDPRTDAIPITELLSEEYAKQRVQGIQADAATEVSPGDISAYLQSDTVYFSVVDSQGNACSMINSNYMGFGSGIPLSIYS